MNWVYEIWNVLNPIVIISKDIVYSSDKNDKCLFISSRGVDGNVLLFSSSLAGQTQRGLDVIDTT